MDDGGLDGGVHSVASCCLTKTDGNGADAVISKGMSMRIAVASGKGGTGKTTVAVGLASALAGTGRAVTYADCDVEEPNGHFFLHPEIRGTFPATVRVPVVDADRCASCGACGEICEYAAIVMIAGKPLVFPGMCHSCGGCALVCPAGAITEAEREIGVIETGARGDVRFVRGRLNVGEALAPPLIRAVRAHIPGTGTAILDCPPGTSCPVVAALGGAEYCLLVTEPTPFGLNDLMLAVELVRELRIPSGVFINRADGGTPDTERYCAENGIPVLGRIPDDRRIAESYSRGDLLETLVPRYGDILLDVWRAIGCVDRTDESTFPGNIP